MSLWTEIHEQPAVLERTARNNRTSLRSLARHVDRHPPSFVLVAARGTSDNAARYAQYVWGARNRLPVALAAPSLFSVYRTPPALDGGLVVGISQSGESPDLVTVLDEARAQGCPTVAITNRPNSPLGRTADICIPLHAGDERAVAATKTYLAQLGAIALLSDALAGTDSRIGELGALVTTVLESSERIRSIATDLTDASAAAVIGRGFNLATSHEWALKLQELTYLPALAYSSADFLHGPVSLVSSGFPVLAVAPGGAVHGGVHRLLQRLADMGSRMVVISDVGPTLDLTSSAIPVPSVEEWLSPIVATVAAQLFTYHLAVARGTDPDAPRTITKITRTL